MDYIICNRKKSKPMVNVKICKKCRYINKCPDYGNYIQPLLFSDLNKVTQRRRVKGEMIRQKTIEITEKQEQLTLHIWEEG